MDAIKTLLAIKELAYAIRCDWSDPRYECREIMDRCDELIKELEK